MRVACAGRNALTPGIRLVGSRQGRRDHEPGTSSRLGVEGDLAAMHTNFIAAIQADAVQ
ncbi:MAG: hypothetical protein M3133_08400 [Actinomycetota bacterium]|nr:hypothetical protein [Actinomycetota bacterium]